MALAEWLDRHVLHLDQRPTLFGQLEDQRGTANQRLQHYGAEAAPRLRRAVGPRKMIWENLILPKKVTIRLLDSREQPMRLANVIFAVHLFARRKNDFDLGPYLSDEAGLVTITEADLRHDVDATYESGLMDYVSVENCHTFVELRLETEDDIHRALHARETMWKNLLKGEKERWSSMENLLHAYRQSSNGRLNVHKGFSRIRDDWDGSKTEYQYEFGVTLKK